MNNEKDLIKILHLSAVKTWGGGENHILNLCKELNNQGGIQNLVLTVKNSGFSKVLNGHKIRKYEAPLKVKFDLRYTFRIISICRKEKIDLIHIHDPTALTLAVTATKLAKLPPFILSKKTSFEIKDRPRTLYKYNHPQIKKILCVSEKTRKIASARIKDTSKLVSIYHGTSLEKKEKTSIDLRKKLNISEEKIIVGTIANHIRAKNLETWVALVDYIINERQKDNFHFVQIGSFTERTQNYQENIRHKNLENHVSFLNFIPQASKLIPQFDISLLTSQSEGVPQFIYESFYYKVPVVSTNVGGIPEIIEDNVNGMLSNPFEAQRLADKLIALSQNKDLMEKFTELSHQKLIEKFTTRKMAEQTLAEYKKVLYGKN